MSETPMTEARIEEIVARVEVGVFGDDPQGDQRIDRRDLRALLADWRAKKAEIERLRANRDKWMASAQEAITELALKQS